MERMTFDRAAHKAEQRTFSLPKPLSVDAATNKVQGYAAVWDVVGSDPRGFHVFPKGSMVLPDYAVVMQYNHNSDWQLASEDNESLKFSSDAVGLATTAQLDNTFIEQYVLTKMSRGMIKGMSLGMFSIKEHKEQRTITAADASGNVELGAFVGKSITVIVYDKWLLDELTITARPVFPQTSIELLFDRAKGFDKESAEEMNNRFIAEIELLGFELD